MNLIQEVTFGLKLVGAIKQQLSNLKNKQPLNFTDIAADIYQFAVGFYPELGMIITAADFENDIKALQAIVSK